MKIITMYSVKIKEYSHIFQDTVKQYRSAVSFFCHVINENWDRYATIIKSDPCSESYGTAYRKDS